MEEKRQGRDNTEAMTLNAESVSEHNALYDELDPEVKLDFLQQAVFEKMVRAELAQEQATFKRAQLKVMQLRERDREDPALGVPNTLSSLRLTPGDVDTLAELWNSGEYRGRERTTSWRSLVTSPCETPLWVQNELVAKEDEIRRETPVVYRPWWSETISENRDAFHGAALFVWR